MSFQNISGLSIEFVLGGFDSIQRPLPVGIVLLLVYLTSLLANLANIYFIVTDKHLHQPMYLFMCNLAIVDIVVCTSVCPTMICTLITGYKTISYAPCIFQMFLFHISSAMEMFAISAMAFDRFVAIASPLRYHSILSNFRCVLISIGLWILACALLIVCPATIIPLTVCHSTLKYVFCDYAALIRASCVDPNPYFNILSAVFSFFYFGSFGFICLTYIKIAVIVLKMSSKSDRKKVLNTCLSHLIVIMCFYVPTFVQAFLTRLGVVLTLEERHGLLIGAFLGPSLVNPFIYCLRTKEIRTKLIRILSKVEPAS
ncbi:olfactory receptor 1M1-like [Astyanax mexicanus]|uniref:Olfactory receptor n=2 Tax=Astyanax mexicanus TaxID=7994 RepID=A0A8B9HQL3_ASTMX|nr:olfactory receptor 1M1-like [Astyanax mexicanus]